MGVFRPFAKRAARLRVGFARDRRGATAIEYGLIMAVVVLTMIVGLSQTATVTVNMWNETSNKVQAAH